MTAAIAASAALVLASPVTANAAPPAAPGGITWNGTSDKAVAVTIDAVQTTRDNASGPKITSNAHSDDFPGVYFIWDSKQKDSGYLKVDATLFDAYDSFTLTMKESSTYWDIQVAPQPGQAKTADGCYVFYVPKAYGDKNINMVLVGSWVTHTNAEPIYLSFGGYWVTDDGIILSEEVSDQTLLPGQCIDWSQVSTDYATWVARGGLANPGNGYMTSGSAQHINDGQKVCYADITPDELTGDSISAGYKQVDLDPGYDMPTVVGDFYRYLADVNLWNQLYQSGDYAGKYVPQEGANAAGDAITLSADAGLAHYNMLCNVYGADSLPPFFHFNWDNVTGDDAMGGNVTFATWADELEVGILAVLSEHPDLVINELAQPVSAFDSPLVALTAYQKAFFDKGELADFITNPPV